MPLEFGNEVSDENNSAEKLFSQHSTPLQPPSRRPTALNDVATKSVAAESILSNHPMFAENRTESRSNNDRYTLDGNSTSPSKLRLDRPISRKREYDHGDSSDESETPGRRQADDVTPKLKRRQPKVAEAYRCVIL